MTDIIRPIVAVILGAVLSIAGSLAFNSSPKVAGAAVVESPKTIPGRQFTLTAGTGRAGSESLSITALSDLGVAQASRRVSLLAQDYPYIEISVSGWKPDQPLFLTWRSTTPPNELVALPLNWRNSNSLALQIGQSPQWRGEIQELGIGLTGASGDTSLELHRIKLFGNSTSIRLTAIWHAWTGFSPWDQSSINFLPASMTKLAPSPTPFMAAWSAVSVVLLLLMTRTFGAPVSGTGLAIALLVPWLTLDGLWQHRLSSQLKQTALLFAGKTQEQKHKIDWDRSVYDYAQYLKTVIEPGPDTRLFIMHNSYDHNPHRLRLQYHLLPLNIYNLGTHLPETRFGSDDYVLLLGPNPGYVYDRDSSTLVWNKCQGVSAALVDAHSQGYLFKITDPTARDLCEEKQPSQENLSDR